MTKLTGVGGVFCAAHRTPEGALHGHSYEVTVWFRHGHDARMLQRHLASVIADLDHGELPEHLTWGEQLAEHFATSLPGAVQVDVSRPLERIYARWTPA